MAIRYLTGANVPPPGGHYSQATLFGGQLFISGQLPIDPTGAGNRNVAHTSFHDQAAQAISNLLLILTNAGGSVKNLVKVTAYIVGAEHWSEFDKVYGQMLGTVRPARTVVPVTELHFGYLVELDAIALGINNPAQHRDTSG